MDEALGPPAAMAERSEELTPMLSQYLTLCERYDDALVLFQVGDFYETFCEAAEATARILEITLTQREDSTGTYPMAGIPIDNAVSYIETLLDAGYRVAVADQVQDADETSGLVDRAVTRVVTPGTLTETELLDDADNNFVACLTEGFGLALLDVSTGDFYATRLDRIDAVEDELERFDPAEAVVGPDAPTDPFTSGCMVTSYDHTAFDLENASETVERYFGAASLASDAEVRACGALLAYAEYARGGTTDGQVERLDYLNHLTRYDPREYMLLDAVALRSLEVFEPRHVHGLEGAALVETLDETSSALGSRKLRDWIRRPLLDPERIEGRLDAVEALLQSVGGRERALERLTEVYDLERLVTRVSRGRADARDLRALESTLSIVPDLRACIDDATDESPALASIHERLDDCPEVRDRVDRAVVESPPVEITEGGVIDEGYDEELDELRRTEREGKAWIDELERRERDRTGVDSLKVGHNSVHGYYIEVTNSNLDSVPDDYRRRQTLKNSERFYTPELKKHEDEVIRAGERADDLEYELFRDVRDEVAAATERIQTTAGAVAELDALCALATVAAEYDYCRPEVGVDGIDVEGGRHPVVERTESAFVPNPTDLPEDRPMAVLTGPNMSGKSTYMRQVALLCVMAQVGSFVPAASAELPLLDRVFTRVGASDDIAGGRSTFMVEMTELATILEDAGEDSLVVLDEVGRGTSTRDGYAIAQAVTEYLHDEVGAYTLFATHHHELTDVAADLPRARNYHFAAERAHDGEAARRGSQGDQREDPAVDPSKVDARPRQAEGTDEITFEHDLRNGAATASYGVEVADDAGVPAPVVQRAESVLSAETGGVSALDDHTPPHGSTDPTRLTSSNADHSDVSDTPDTSDATSPATSPDTSDATSPDTTDPPDTDDSPDVTATASADGGELPEELLSDLRSVDLADTTPLEALNLLARLQKRVQ